MKRNILIILPLLLILTGCTFKETQKYRSGKDTFLSVGDGRFQISSFISEYSPYDEKSEYSLYDEKKTRQYLIIFVITITILMLIYYICKIKKINI